MVQCCDKLLTVSVCMIYYNNRQIQGLCIQKKIVGSARHLVIPVFTIVSAGSMFLCNCLMQYSVTEKVLKIFVKCLGLLAQTQMEDLTALCTSCGWEGALPL